VEFIDYAVSKYRRKVKFLNFQEAQERLNKIFCTDNPCALLTGRTTGFVSST